MASNFELKTLAEVLRSYGRGVVFRAERWDPETGDPLALVHLGDTEGDIVFNPQAEVTGLTLPELTGPAIHEADSTGENPTLELPLFLADPALYPIVSPNGSAHGGRSNRVAAAEHTLAIFPEALFGESREALVCTNGAWTLGGVALTSAQLALLDAALWLWRGFFSRPPRSFKGGAGDARKNIETVTFQVMHHDSMPEGHKLYTTGDPADSGIDLEGGS